MYATTGVGTRARWEVKWFHKGKWWDKQFNNDFAGALEFYTKVLSTNRKAVTLRCKNISFPPPDKYADPKYVIITKKVGGETKKFKKRDGILIPREYQHEMHEVNLKGFFWCPYCVKMRKFRKDDRESGVVMACPACGISHEMQTVRKYNPIAVVIGNMRKTRSDKGIAR